MLVHAIVVAGDGARAHVDAGAHGGVADVGQVRHLGALADRGLLDFHVCAGLGAIEHVGARAQVGARAAVDAVLDDGLDGDGLIDDAAAADGGVGEAAVGAELALLAHGDVTDQMRLRPHDGVAADGGVGTDPGLRGVDERDAFCHPVLVDAVARDGGELRELDAAVDAQAVAVVVTVEDGDRLAVTLEDFEHVGQVVLGLRVVVADLVNVGGELRAVKGVAAGVALQQRGGLLGRAVLLLDDALDLTIGAQLDAAVAERIGRGHGHDGAGELAGGDGLRELGDGVGGDERQVAVEHDDGALRDAAGLERDLYGVAGAQALGLLDALDLGGAVGVGAVDEGAHLVGVAADDDHDAAAAGLDGSVDDPLDHGLAQDLVRNLAVVRLHAGALAGSEDNCGCVHVISCYVIETCVWKRYTAQYDTAGI